MIVSVCLTAELDAFELTHIYLDKQMWIVFIETWMHISE